MVKRWDGEQVTHRALAIVIGAFAVLAALGTVAVFIIAIVEWIQGDDEKAHRFAIAIPLFLGIALLLGVFARRAWMRRSAGIRQAPETSALPPQDRQTDAFATAAVVAPALFGYYAYRTVPFPEFDGFAFTGAAIGLLIGLVVYVDIKRHSSATSSPTGVPAHDLAGSTAPSDAWYRQLIPVIMLLVPVVIAILVWQQLRLNVPNALAYALQCLMVPITSVLAYVEVRRMPSASDSIDSKSIGTSLNPSMTFSGMFLIWMLWYPLYFLQRRQFGGKPLFLPAVCVVLLVNAPRIEKWYRGTELPPVDAPEVISLVVDCVQRSPEYSLRRAEIGTIQVTGATQISHDPKAQVRTARASLHSNLGVEPIHYTVAWLDSAKETIVVTIVDPP